MSSSPPLTSTDRQPVEGSTVPENFDNGNEEAEKNYNPTSFTFWSIMAGVYLSIFLVAIDRTIIAVAIPAITNDFNSIEDIGWYGSAYMLTAAGFFPVMGRVYQIFSIKWTFLISIVVFEVGSIVCGAAPTSVSFIVGRAIAGLGSSGIFCGGMMIIIPLVPLRKRPTYTALYGITFGISSILGPIIGGAFTDKVTWRWCFYINLPIGGFTLLAIFAFLHIDTTTRDYGSWLSNFQHLDPIGLLIFLPSMVCLILALQWGGTADPWSSGKIIGLLVTFGVLFVAFIIYEALTPETAMAPAHIVANRSIAGAMFYMFGIASSIILVVYYISIWFQAVKGESATHAGISTIPLVFGMLIFSGICARLIERIGYYVPFMILGAVLCAVGTGMLSTMTRFSNHSAWIGYQALLGFGLGAGFQQPTLAAQKVLSREDVSIGMALVFFMQQLSGAVFLAIAQNIFQKKLIQDLSGIQGLDTMRIINTGATDLRKLVPVDQLDTVVDAFNDAIMKVFLMAAILSAVMVLGALVMEWKSIKTEPKSDNNIKNDAEKTGQGAGSHS